jgi:hypothetical protein
MVTTRATGTFDVKLAVQANDEYPEGTALGRRSIDKRFHGDLDATSKGEMLSAGTKAPGSGVYVAIERVEGTLDGRRGTFVLHHTGLMARGTPSLSVSVAPDSGTGELAGLTGAMRIIIEGGQHSYEFDYAIEA